MNTALSFTSKFPANIRKIFIITALIILSAIPIFSETQRDPSGIGLNEKLDQKLSTDLTFFDESGKPVQLSSYFRDSKTPIVLIPGYYGCSRLCTQVFNVTRDMIKDNISHKLLPGRDYLLLSISFNPDDTPAEGAKLGKEFRSGIPNYTISENGWIFLTGKSESIDPLMDSIGYLYKKDGMDYSHPSALAIITPQGNISKYLNSLSLSSRDFRFALIEAADGRIGELTDLALQFCFRWDNIEKQYTPFAVRFIQIGSMLTLFFIIFLVILNIMKRKKR